MPVSVFNDTISAAIRDTLSSSNSIIKSDDPFNCNNNQLISSTKHFLLTKIEYDETSNFKASQDLLKTKYIYLKAKCNGLQSNNNKVTAIEKENKPIINSDIGTKLQQSCKEIRLNLPKRVLFPRENVQLGWKSSGRKWKIGAGMINVGNTCYLNSALQAIFHVPAFANWLISDSIHRDKCQNQDNCIVCLMADTLIESQKNDGAIKPWKIYSRLRLICRHFIPNRQEDAHEFLRYLIDAMEKSYLLRFKNSKELDQHTKETTPLNQILGGYLRSAVRCLSCGYVSTTFQHFEDIILDIRKANSIEEALTCYFARERLEDMGYTCESCKKKVSATKQFSLERPPAVLCIQLKRFIIGSKLNKHISIRIKLDLSQFLSTKRPPLSLTYKLVSMVTHLGGSQHSGHYTAIGLTDVNGFYQFDDSFVRPISIPNVLTTNAYVMFYELENINFNTPNTSNAIPNCTTVSSSVDKENNGFHNTSMKPTTITCSTNNQTSLSTNLNINRNISSSVTSTSNNQNKEINGHKIGFIGPMLPPKMQSQINTNSISNNNVSSTSISPIKAPVTTITSNHTTPTKTLQNGYVGSKLVFNNNNSNKNGVVNISNVLKRTNSDQSIEIQKTPEKKPNLLIIKTLPSMPKLLDEAKMTVNQLPTKPIVNNATKTSTEVNGNIIKKVNGASNQTIQQSNKNGKPMSLVPYGSHDDSDNDSDENTNKQHKRLLQNDQIVETTVISSSSNSAATSDNDEDDEGFNDDDDDATTTIIELQTGIWTVSPINENKTKTSPNLKNYNNTNSIAKGNKILTNNNFFNHATKTANNNNNNNYNDNSIKRIISKKKENNINKTNNSTVGQLIKMGHNGYGMNIQSWNGGKSIIEKEILEEKQNEKKRLREDEYENDMDRGRTKKIKLHGLQGADNPGYNAFQETDTHQQQRWRNNNGKFYHTVFRHNPHHHRNHNGFRGRNNRNFNSQHRGHHHKRDNYRR